MGGKFIVIEYDVLECKQLSNTEKVLYGYIVALSQKHGCCFASNNILCELVGIKKRQLIYCLLKLQKLNFILIKKECLNEKTKRIIKPTINQFIEYRDKQNTKKEKELIEYDWLNE